MSTLSDANAKEEAALPNGMLPSISAILILAFLFINIYTASGQSCIIALPFTLFPSGPPNAPHAALCRAVRPF